MEGALLTPHGPATHAPWVRCLHHIARFWGLGCVGYTTFQGGVAISRCVAYTTWSGNPCPLGALVTPHCGAMASIYLINMAFMTRYRRGRPPVTSPVSVIEVRYLHHNGRGGMTGSALLTPQLAEAAWLGVRCLHHIAGDCLVARVRCLHHISDFR